MCMTTMRKPKLIKRNDIGKLSTAVPAAPKSKSIAQIRAEWTANVPIGGITKSQAIEALFGKEDK